MKMHQRTLIGLAVAAALSAGAAHAQVSDNIVKIGVLSDMSSLYTDLAGAGSVVAAKMAGSAAGAAAPCRAGARVKKPLRSRCRPRPHRSRVVGLHLARTLPHVKHVQRPTRTCTWHCWHRMRADSPLKEDRSNKTWVCRQLLQLINYSSTASIWQSQLQQW